MRSSCTTTRDFQGREIIVSLLRRAILAVVILYGSWLGMMGVHELGHFFHAVISGGHVRDVSLPLLGFSQTIVEPNPREHFVVWGGPIWGAVLPLLACIGVGLVRKRVPAILAFFAGFCLASNGVYIGIGWIWRAGDTGEMLRLGTPLWVMISFGVGCVVGGFAMLHGLGRISGFFLPVHPPVASTPRPDPS